MAQEIESLDSVYERLSTLVNVMDRNDVHLIKVSINTNFLNSLQPEWSKYVTLTHQNKDLSDVEYDLLYDTLLQFEPHVQASKVKKAAKNHGPSALIAHSNQAANARNGQVQQIDESNQMVQHVPRTDSNLGRENVQYYNCNAKGTLNKEENDFMLDNAYGDETLEELTTIVIMMTRIQPANDNAETEPKYDAKAVSESIQTIYMLGKRPNKVYDHFLKAGLGYQSLKRLKKDIAAQPKMYDGERLHNMKLIIDSPDYEETLKDAEESRLKMKNKMIQLNYAKLNALYETFVPQKEFFAEQTYFSTPFTSNVSFESSKKDIRFINSKNAK
nr:hypothetical protein [Tanacetum cinerariifolium]